MESPQDIELVPLKVGFDIAWRGFNRAQVKQHLDDLAGELRLMAADRDAALSQVDALTETLETLRSESDSLRIKVEKLSRGPVSGGELSERLQRMLELANAEAAEITSRAQAAAEQTWASAQESANALKRRYERLLVDLQEQQRNMVAEHRSVMAKARSDVDRMTSQAQARCRELEANAEKRRNTVEEDFRISMDDRRRTVTKEIEDERASSRATAEKLVREATGKANRLVSEASEASKRRVTEAEATASKLLSEATAKAEARVADANSTAERKLTAAQQQVDTLQALRDQLNGQLTSALDLMRDAAPLLSTGETESGDDSSAPAEAVENGHDQQVPGQQRHSAVPPSRAKGATKPRLTPVNAGASRSAD